MNAPPRRAGLIGAFAAIYFIWGSTYLAIRYVVEAVPPFLAIAFRCTMGALLLFGWLTMRRGLVRPTGRQWALSILAGALLFAAGQAVLAWAERRVPSGTAALILTAIPLWMVLLQAVHARQFPSRRVVAGLLLGVAGVAVLGTGAGGATGREQVLLVAAALAWALGSIVAREGLSTLPSLQSTAMQLTGGGLVLAAVSLLAGEFAHWSLAMITPRAAGALAFLVLCGTIIGFVAYTWLLRVGTAHAVGTYAFVNPVVAVGLAWLTGDERIGPATAMAAGLVLGAVVLIRHQPGRSRTSRLTPDSPLRTPHPAPPARAPVFRCAGPADSDFLPPRVGLTRQTPRCCSPAP